LETQVLPASGFWHLSAGSNRRLSCYSELMRNGAARSRGQASREASTRTRSALTAASRENRDDGADFDHGTRLWKLLTRGEPQALDPDLGPVDLSPSVRLDPRQLQQAGEAIAVTLAKQVQESRVSGPRHRRISTSYDHLVASAEFDAAAGLTVEQ
jgi:hypothetical protein